MSTSQKRDVRRRHISRILLLAACVALPSDAADFTVDDTTDAVDANSSDALCQTAAGHCSLRAAIQQANALPGTHTITVPIGTYRLSLAGAGEDAALTGDLDILAEVDLVGAGPDATVIDAASIDRAFDIQGSAPVVISGVTIRRGAATGSAGTNHLGGGILLASGATLDLDNCALTANSANAGGAIRAGNGSDLSIFNCRFRDNTILDLGFTNQEGSAILSKGSVDLERVEVSANNSSRQFSGAVEVSNGSALTLRNVTVSGNQGTGVRALNSDLDLVNTSILRNTFDGLRFSSSDGNDSLTVRNSLLANNDGSDCASFNPPTNMDFAGEHNLDSDGSCPLDDTPPTVDLPLTDPGLGPLALHGGHTKTHVPLDDSPVIDAGNNDRCEAEDQRGAPRPLDVLGGGTICDIGAVEVLPCDVPFDADEVLPFFETSGPSPDLIEACFTIINGTTFRVLAGGTVTWRTRNSMSMQNGFEVQPGATFTAEIDPDAGSAIDLP
jgi:CSLREA domain-containing protein